MSRCLFIAKKIKHRIYVKYLILYIFIFISQAFYPAYGQENIAELKEKAAALVKEHKYLEALPLLEKITAADQNDAEAFFNLGSALLVKSIAINDPAGQKEFRVRAREAFIKSKNLGKDTTLVRAFIDAIPADGSKEQSFSNDPRSDALTVAGEREFVGRNLDKAIELYKLALEADPKNYFAALFIGDCYLGKESYADAEIWYQRAISIDPNIETAYRYSATPLMKQGKFAEARDRYIEAWITEPYNRFALNGLLQWGKITKTQLGHPKIEPPKTETGADGNVNTTINVNPLSDDGSMAWIAYVSTRELWRKERFKQKFPNEKTYRHTLAEEADALRAVLQMAKSFKVKNLNPQIDMIGKLDSEGFLEAFILLALADKGIAADHPAYLRENRSKLRDYVKKYVIGPPQ